MVKTTIVKVTEVKPEMLKGIWSGFCDADNCCNEADIDRYCEDCGKKFCQIHADRDKHKCDDSIKGCHSMLYEKNPKDEHEKLSYEEKKPLSGEDIVKIWYFEKYKPLIKKEDILKAMHYEYKHSYDYGEVLEILKEARKQAEIKIAELEEKIKNMEQEIAGDNAFIAQHQSCDKS